MKHLPPHLQRRSFLRLGLGTAALLALAGGTAIWLMEPGVANGRLSASARTVLRSLAPAILADLLPSDAPARATLLEATLDQTERLLAQVPQAARDEASQLLALLATVPGRRLLAGLATPWEQASAAEVAAALGGMRASGQTLRIQAYQGLHDLVCFPFFTQPQAWAAIGYPGPSAV